MGLIKRLEDNPKEFALFLLDQVLDHLYHNRISESEDAVNKVCEIIEDSLVEK